jgi:HEAT repeat protein
VIKRLLAGVMGTTLVAGALLAGTAPAQSKARPAPAAVPQPRAASVATQPPAVQAKRVPRALAQSPFPQDPADSLYRAARAALNRSDFRRAAQLFHQIPVSYSRSAYVADALYWEAFALYRVGAASDLEGALRRLEEQARSYPRASTRRDADALATRIRGALAQQGNARAAQRVAREAAAAATPPANRPAAQGCAKEDDDLRAAALNALIQMDAEQAVPMLRQVLARRDACAGPLREQAVFLLAQKRTPETETLLLNLARSDADPAVREQAVFWLSQVPGDRSLELLQEILRTGGDEAIREKAIFALSQHSSPRATEVLRGLAEQQSLPDALREQAIFWIGQRGPESAAFLRALYGRLDNPALREKVIFSLAQMGGQGSERWLLDLAANERETEDMREKALFWAAQSQTVSIAELSGLYDRLQSPKLREQAIFGLAQRNQSAALDKLIEIARSDRDREMRKKALFWLGQNKDPRAAQAIFDIINQQ